MSAVSYFEYWAGGPCPVRADERVEVLEANGRRAIGIALAFNWGRGGNDGVVAWRRALKVPMEAPAPVPWEWGSGT